MQRSDPLAHKVFAATKEVTRKIEGRFLLPEAFQEEEVITEDIIDDEENYLPLEEVLLA